MKKSILILFFVLMLLISGCSVFKEKEVSIKAVSVNTDGTIHIEGRGRAFESTIGLKVTDENGFVLFEGSTVTDAKDWVNLEISKKI